MQSRSFYRVLPYIVCFLACAAVDLFYFPRATVFPDEQRILGSAIRLAASGEFWVGSDRAWEMPGTAIFLAPFVWLFGPNNAIVPIRLAQAILVTIQCGLIAQISGRIFKRRDVGFVASCIAAIYPFMLFYQGLLLSETLFNSFLLAGLAALFWWRDRGMRIDFVLVTAMVFFALASLTRASLTILPPFILAATAWFCGSSFRRTCGILLAALCVYAAVMGPWGIRNGVLFHALVPFSTNGGMNLYLGNNSRNLNGGLDWANDVDPAFVAKTNAIPGELERQHAYSEAAIAYIKNNPAIFFRNAVKKFVRFWNIIPNAVELRSAFHSVTTAASFGPILAFALICGGRRWRQWRLLAPLYMLIGYFTFVHVVTIASLRYRFPIEPLLIILAAEPIAALIAYFRSQSQDRRSAAKD
jgi:hypothetical protein